MFELIIKFANGNTYWIDHFSSLAAAQKWLAEERTRPYWKQEFTTEIIDHTPPPYVEPPEETQRKAAILVLVNRLKDLDDQADLTVAEIKECLRKTVKLLRLKGQLT